MNNPEVMQTAPGDNLRVIGEPRTVVLWLPYPPSANKLWRAVNGRQIKSGYYREWMVRAVLAIRTQLPRLETITGKYHLHIRATPPDRRRRDLDNLAKPLGDALTAAGVVSDDSNLNVLLMHWQPDITKGGSIEVIVKEAA